MTPPSPLRWLSDLSPARRQDRAPTTHNEATKGDPRKGIKEFHYETFWSSQSSGSPSEDWFVIHHQRRFTFHVSHTISQSRYLVDNRKRAEQAGVALFFQGGKPDINQELVYASTENDLSSITHADTRTARQHVGVWILVELTLSLILDSLPLHQVLEDRYGGN